MIELIIGNSLCRILGLKSIQLRELRKLMLYERRTGKWVKEPAKDKAGKQRFDPKTKKPLFNSVPQIEREHLMAKDGRFPTGLLYIVENYLADRSLPHEVMDARERPATRPETAPTMFRPGACPTPYPEQVQAAQAATEHGRGIIVAPTGLGKSIIAAIICDQFQVRSVIVVPKVELKNQLTDSLREFFGEGAAGPLVDGKAKHWITVENIDAIKGADLTGVNMVLIDEFHRAGAAGYRKENEVNWDGIYFKLGMTATPFRSRDEERLLLESVLSQVIYRITYQQAVDKGYIVPVEAYYYDLPETDLPETIRSFAGVYNALIVENSYRNCLIAHLAANLVDAKASTLILTKIVNHGERIEQLLADTGHRVPFAEGKKGSLNRSLIADFNSGQTDGLVGTSGIMGEGVDTKRCEWVILAGLGKSKTQFMQQVGRGVRRFPGKESAKIILFRDASHIWTLAHFDAQVKYLRQEYGVEPMKLDLPFKP